ncbi:MAG: glycosyltransferase family 9 protein [Candidatus Hydrothermales bacterium]
MILVRIPNWIGDAVISRGFLRALKENVDSEIFVIGKEYLKDIFYDYNFFGFKSYKDYFKILKHFKNIGFEKIFILPFSFSSAFFPFLAGIKFRVGIDSDNRGFILTHKVSSFYIKREHLLKSFLRLIGLEENFNNFIPNFDKIKVDEKNDLVIIAPQASYGKTKEWLFFKDLAKFLLKEGFEVLIVGKRKEESYPKGVVDLREKTNLSDILKIISESKYVFSNDSGIAHIASALGKKVFVFFGSTLPLWTKPLGENVFIFYKKISCSPCFKRVCMFGTYECLRKINLEEVVKVFNILR